MALGDPYASIEEYREVTGADSHEHDAEIERDLIAVSRYIDSKVARPLGFNQDATAVARVYSSPAASGYPDGWAESENPWKATGLSRYLDIDDHVSIASVEIDESHDGTYGLALTAGDYELLPRNAATRPEPEPYRQILLTPHSAIGAWPSGGRVRVTGIGGWPSVPQGIVSATIELTRILRIESPRASSAMNEMQQVLTTSRVAQGIVSDLVAKYLSPASFF